jgi:uncharacterized protein
VPGVLHPSTIMYYPEIKTYANRPDYQDAEAFRALPGLYLAGDGAGTSRGITAAWASGIRVAGSLLSTLPTRSTIPIQPVQSIQSSRNHQPGRA